MLVTNLDGICLSILSTLVDSVQTVMSNTYVGFTIYSVYGGSPPTDGVTLGTIAGFSPSSWLAYRDNVCE